MRAGARLARRLLNSAIELQGVSPMKQATHSITSTPALPLSPARRRTSGPTRMAAPAPALGLVLGLTLASSVPAQDFEAGKPLGSTNEAGVRTEMSDNVTVYGSFHFAESCTFDPERNLIIAMNAGERSDVAAPDGYASLIHPDGRVHTSKWIGATRDGLELISPLGSAIRDGVLYTADSGFVRSFDLETGRPLNSIQVPDAGFLNGIAVDGDGTAYVSDTRPGELIWKVTAAGEVSVFAEGGPLTLPNGVALDNDGNIVVVNIGSRDVVTYSPDGAIVRTEQAAESGSDGVVVLPDGTKYVSSVRYGSVSKLVAGEKTEVIATGIPSAASMCYDSTQHQLVIPMNPNNALAFIRL
jgi:sugar lactone lactonase YvrE